MNGDIVPMINLEAARMAGSGSDWDKAAKQIDDACYNSGFFMISGHGIADELSNEVSQVSGNFFSLSASEKLQLHFPGHGLGYIPFETELLCATIDDTGHGDLKESLNICADFENNVWPKNPPQLQNVLERLFKEMHGLTDFLMDLCAVALKLPQDFFRQYIDHPKATLRLSYYPAVTLPPHEGQSRVTAHTDYGTLSILDPDPYVGGLQIFYRGEKWIDIHNPKGAFVVNIGDAMQIWTNDKWKSTLHRVIAPQGSGFETQDRLSLVFLHNPSPDATITPVKTCVSEKFPAKYQPINAGEHLRQKSHKSRGEA